MLIHPPFYACDWPGCSIKWPVNAKNSSMLLVWGIDPKIIRLRRGHVVLEENIYNFCAHHAIEVVEIMRPRIVNLKTQEGPDFIEDMGCFVSGRILNGNINQRVFNHQFSYDDYEDLYWFYVTNILSPKDCIENNIGYI